MELITRETGKPLNGLSGIGSGMEVGGTAAWIGATTELTLPVDVLQDDDEARIEVHRRPLGVVGSITPWNWPLMISIWHVMPALRAGNTVVLKPSEYTPTAVARFVELAQSVLPPGVLNLVTGDGEVGAAISRHPDIDKVVFTGSTATGRRIMEGAAGNLKRLTLELGGNDAGIVLPDVDVEAIAPKLFTACFHNNGQTCAALKRLYVHDSVYDKVVNALAGLAREVKVGDGMKEDTQLGPIQNRVQLGIVEALVADARERGATIATGGQAVDGPGLLFSANHRQRYQRWYAPGGRRTLRAGSPGDSLYVDRRGDRPGQCQRQRPGRFDLERRYQLRRQPPPLAWNAVRCGSTITRCCTRTPPSAASSNPASGWNLASTGWKEFTALQTVKLMKQ